MVYCSHFILVCRCNIFVLLYFSRCLLVIFSVRPGQVFREPCLVALRSLDAVGMKISELSYCASYGLVVYSRMLFVTASYFFQDNFPHSSLIVSCPFLWNKISCLYSVLVHPSSHKTPNDISGAVFIGGKCECS